VHPSDFVHLHNHSTYSLLEGLPSPEEIVLRAKELGQTAVGLTDKGYTYGLVEFEQYARKHGLKPILGMVAYVAARTRFDRESGIDTKSHSLTLLVENREGYQNLLRLATLAALEGMYYKPRVDAELLTKYGKGLIALSGPITAAIPQAALAEDGERIRALVEQYRSFVGPDNLYFELMDLPNVTGQMEVNQQLIKWGKELNVPLVVTGNSYYTRPDDAEAHDILLCIQKNANVSDPGRFSMRDADYSMRPFEELEKAFAHVPEALENTRRIADRCDVQFQYGTNHIPRFPVPGELSEETYLTQLCEDGFKRRYPDPPAGHHERLEYELSIIKQVGFSGYFLIVADFVTEARRRGITVGPGRGSAAGSMVSYCLGITGVDPMEHGLLFERFLNPERVSMPDIDLDFADTRRDEILEYVRQKYGTDRVVQICTFGTLAARAAVKDVGRAYGMSFLEMNSLAKLIPERPGTKLKEALETSELKAAYEGNETYRRIIDAALKLEGKARHVSIHACGVIISPEPAVNYTAVQRAPKDENIIITQYHAKPLEALGLLKMDFLGLMNLTVIQTTLEIIKRTRGEDVDIGKIPLDSKPAFALLQRGDTTGVFQLESGGMRRYLKQLKPTEFADITAMVSLYRPGPMDWIPSYIKRKHGREKVEYVHDDLKPILEPTYGIGVYQEQILQIAQVFAGFSLGEADLLRRAIGKKIKKELDAQREKFISGSVAKGYAQKLAEKIFDDVITPFAGYGFNKSHAVGYARIAYETAYLKANYPAEFMAALLTSDADDTERVTIEIEETRAMGIEVLPPDVNESRSQFTVVSSQGSVVSNENEVVNGQKSAVSNEDEKEVPSELTTDHSKLTTQPTTRQAIRFGLAAVKGVGESSVHLLIEERDKGGKFASIEDFAKRLPTKILNKKLIESLAKAGALDSFAERRTLVEHYALVADYRKETGDADGAQASLLSGLGDSMEEATIEFPPTPPATPQQKLTWEKETLGLYVSSHPLAGLKKYISRKAQLVGSLTTKEVGKKVTIAGIQEGIKKIRTKKGETMAIIFLEDPTAKIEVTLFPRTYNEVAGVLEQPDTVLVIGGTLDLRGGQLQLRADAIKRSSLSAMVARAKENDLFDEEEAKRGLTITKRMLEDEEAVELVDEEGNVIAGEKVVLKDKEDDGDEFLAPLGKWILKGMPTEEVLAKLKGDEERLAVSDERLAPEGAPSSEPLPATRYPLPAGGQAEPSPHTIDLPARAPKQLLLDLKDALTAFPGHERIQLNIGGQKIALPLMVEMSPALEDKIQKIIRQYAVAD
jgi:DNA polymerase III subunit alpha